MAFRLATLMHMDNRHLDPLRRLYQADKMWCDDGNEPVSFHLQYTGGGPIISHPCWTPGWSVPSEHTIDDLKELEILRVEPHAPHEKNRTFAFTMKGRAEAKAVAEKLTIPTAVDGQAPTIDQTLLWLVRLRGEAPECFQPPIRLLDRAVSEGHITTTGREPLARQLLGLVADGYLRGEVPAIDQGSDEQLLEWTPSLETTIQAHEQVATVQAGPQLTFNAPVLGSQIAAGDITNYSFFTAVLDQAHAAIDGFDDYDEDTRRGAKELLDRLRGKVTSASGAVVTGTSVALALEAIKSVFGI